MGCGFFTEERHYRGSFRNPVVITRCRADEHVCSCGGTVRDCDKELHLCPHAIKQGYECFCRHVKEIRECKTDMDLCDLPVSEQARMEWRNIKETLKCDR